MARTSNKASHWWQQLSNFSAEKSAPVIYGVTDRSQLPWWEKINDWLIDRTAVKISEKVRFYQSLHLLLSAGIGLVRALSMLSERYRNPRFRRIVQTIIYDLNHGKTLSAAIHKYPTVFSLHEVKSIQAGEMGGQLEHTLELLAQDWQRVAHFRGRIRRALSYPMVALAGVILALVIILLVVIPRLEALFADFGGELPWMTQVLISSSNLLSVGGGWLIFGGVSAFFAARAWAQSRAGKKTLHGIFLEAPMFGGLVREIQTFQVANQLGNLLQSNVPLEIAIKVLPNLVSNQQISTALGRVKTHLQQGEKLSTSLERIPWLDPVLGEVVQLGEESGTLGAVLQKLADQYSIEIDSQLDQINTLIEPLVILLVGGVIGFLALAIMSPILQIQAVIV